MKTIHKYPLSLTLRQTLFMRKGAKVLCVQFQLGLLALWAEVDPTEELIEKHEFVIVGTGHVLPEDANTYVGTVQEHSGMFIWHVYEVLT